MAAVTDDIRKSAPDCPLRTCPALAGDPWCYTATGFRRQWHADRRKLALGVAPAAAPTTGSKTGARPTEAQHRITAAAMSNGGLYELSGYRFHGDAQRRRAMEVMAGEERSWFRRVRETQHGTLYELTDQGRSAHYRYEDWMNGDTKK